MAVASGEGLSHCPRRVIGTRRGHGMPGRVLADPDVGLLDDVLDVLWRDDAGHHPRELCAAGQEELGQRTPCTRRHPQSAGHVQDTRTIGTALSVSRTPTRLARRCGEPLLTFHMTIEGLPANGAVICAASQHAPSTMYDRAAAASILGAHLARTRRADFQQPGGRRDAHRDELFSAPTLHRRPRKP